MLNYITLSAYCLFSLSQNVCVSVFVCVSLCGMLMATNEEKHWYKSVTDHQLKPLIYI